MLGLLFVHWNMNPEIFRIGGFAVRWYGVLFVSGFILGYWMFTKFCQKERVDTKMLDPLLFTLLIGTLVGSRLGHCSHGGAMMLVLCMIWFAHKYGPKYHIDFMWLVDHLAIAVAFAGAFIRLGNLCNSEIYGDVTSLPWGFIFERRGETEPKHPTQIYESLSYFILGLILVWIYVKRLNKTYRGTFIGIFFIVCFGMRFLIEFIKEPQVEFEESMALDMGQWLSMQVIKALFFDIDGTLLSFNTHRMSEGLKAALWKARDKGLKLFISTGRSPHFFGQLEGFPFDGYIAMNGALNVVDGKIVDHSPLEKETSMRIADFAMRENVPCWTFGKDVSAINCMNEVSTELANQTLIKPDRFYDLREVAENNDIYEYSIFMTEEEINSRFVPVFRGLTYPRWHPYFCDIVNEGLSKSLGAAKILESLGIKREECMAFGDGGNDIPIIEYAGIGVAMGNATDNVKAAADYVTLSVDEDGIPAALCHFGLV